MMARRLGPLACLLVGLHATQVSTLRAQSTAGPIGGDGRVHAPSSKEVGYAPLRPDEVTTIVLHPLHGALLRFPFSVREAVVADAGSFGITKYENTTLLWTKTCPQGCATTAYVYLDDGELTPVPFLLVVDTTRPPTIKRDFSDPVSARLQTREAEMAQAFERSAQRLVADQLTAEVERCVAAGFAFKTVDRRDTWQNAETGEAISVHVVDVGHSGRCLERPQLYVRYRIENAQYATLDRITMRAVRRRKDGSERALTTLADRRTPVVVPALRSVRGELIVDASVALDAGESLWMRATVSGHALVIGPLLRAPDGAK
ncbi:MAG: hypothetical protein H3C62_00415 [Gemmatimonadaceae bacterium]|nr:hypothetical protein [Gemmatimonadaceae bacterium]